MCYQEIPCPKNVHQLPSKQVTANGKCRQMEENRMKKLVTACCIALLLLSLCPSLSQAKVDREPGGMGAFIIGCCWGLREGTEWNEGADMHWREWLQIVPYVNIVIGIWNGIECYQGVTAHEWAAANGANWY